MHKVKGLVVILQTYIMSRKINRGFFFNLLTLNFHSRFLNIISRHLFELGPTRQVPLGMDQVSTLYSKAKCLFIFKKKHSLLLNYMTREFMGS